MKRRKNRLLWVVLIVAISTLARLIAFRCFPLEEYPAEPPSPIQTEEPSPSPIPTVHVVSQIDTAEGFAPASEPFAAECLAKTLWGEARGCSPTQQAAVAWCVLNRLDSDDPYFKDCDSVYDIVSQPSQFHGYNAGNPVTDELLMISQDVLYRWGMETRCIGSVGRVLPKEFIYFSGDGNINHFRTEYYGGTVWDWSLPSPYEE